MKNETQLQMPTCLVVECDQNWQQRLRERLEEEGFWVDSASDPKEVIRKLQSRHFDLMTLDLTLEQVEVNHLKRARRGFELLTQLNKRGDLVIPPIIVISGTEFVEDAVDLLNITLRDLSRYKLLYFAHKKTFYRLGYIEEFTRAAQHAIGLSRTKVSAPKEKEVEAKTEKTCVFVSKSFAETDREINTYFEGILHSLNINYQTGFDYQGLSPPEKVKQLIDMSRGIIAILVRRWIDQETNQPHVPIWLIREIGYAEGQGKPSIILVEEGVRDLAGLDMDHELIFFDRDRISKLQQATHLFLRAIYVHNLTLENLSA